MSRKLIDLEYPYNTRWSHGYIVTNGDGRKHIVLGTNKSITSYARYVVSTALGRFLNESEVVDHIDDDKTNDNLENLQILTRAENAQKEGKRRGRKMVEIECPSCKEIFIRRSGNTQIVESKKGMVTCCSWNCRSEFLKENYSKSEREIISEKSILRIFSM